MKPDNTGQQTAALIEVKSQLLKQRARLKREIRVCYVLVPSLTDDEGDVDARVGVEMY